VVVQPSAYPTNFLTSIQMPAGTEVTKSYGGVGQIPDAMFKAFMSKFELLNTPWQSSVTYFERIHLALKAGKHRGIYGGCAPGASRFARRAKPTANPKVERTSRSRAA
jgi:hypothetical protein